MSTCAPVWPPSNTRNTTETGEPKRVTFKDVSTIASTSQGERAHTHGRGHTAAAPNDYTWLPRHLSAGIKPVGRPRTPPPLPVLASTPLPSLPPSLFCSHRTCMHYCSSSTPERALVRTKFRRNFLLPRPSSPLSG